LAKGRSVLKKLRISFAGNICSWVYELEPMRLSFGNFVEISFFIDPFFCAGFRTIHRVLKTFNGVEKHIQKTKMFSDFDE
jgi:hypothetical protein